MTYDTVLRKIFLIYNVQCAFYGHLPLGPRHKKEANLWSDGGGVDMKAYFISYHLLPQLLQFLVLFHPYSSHSLFSVHSCFLRVIVSSRMPVVPDLFVYEDSFVTPKIREHPHANNSNNSNHNNNTS
jgi:hypothetical protein